MNIQAYNSSPLSGLGLPAPFIGSPYFNTALSM
jgi:hypothetical protein